MTTARPDDRVNQVYRQLIGVIDPELGLSIIKLGLVYDIQVTKDEVAVTMTLTTRGCPLEAAIRSGVERAVRALPWVAGVEVRLVWEPAWNPSMIR
jgi:metal-sulfur cluster biosynthetic enzyme